MENDPKKMTDAEKKLNEGSSFWMVIFLIFWAVMVFLLFTSNTDPNQKPPIYVNGIPMIRP